jgi:hypothetical protein
MGRPLEPCTHDPPPSLNPPLLSLVVVATHPPPSLTNARLPTGIMCEGEQPLVLSCPGGLVINVTAASYGRALSTLCAGPNGKCPAADVTLTLVGQCNGRTSCSLTTAVGIDPCPNIRKYLQVSYVCNGVRPTCSGATYLAGLACVPCPANCAACSASGCSACSAGFVPYQGGCGEPAGRGEPGVGAGLC